MSWCLWHSISIKSWKYLINVLQITIATSVVILIVVVSMNFNYYCIYHYHWSLGDLIWWWTKTGLETWRWRSEGGFFKSFFFCRYNHHRYQHQYHLVDNSLERQFVWIVGLCKNRGCPILFMSHITQMKHLLKRVKSPSSE